MSEIPLQASLFGDKLVDTRTRTQKKRDKQLQAPQQMVMFSTPEMAQFGVNPHPLLPLSPDMVLRLLIQDPRTDDQRLQDALREANLQTHSLLEQVHASYHRAAWLIGALHHTLTTQPDNELALWTLYSLVGEHPNLFKAIAERDLYWVKQTPAGQKIRQPFVQPRRVHRASVPVRPASRRERQLLATPPKEAA
ncbi:MAG: hypothetical protein H6673_10005 [Anaerolineales bacterium]|nr:hypothetical protein [Anaerolineales bacterium]